MKCCLPIQLPLCSLLIAHAGSRAVEVFFATTGKSGAPETPAAPLASLA
jgi:hypothetical protein